MNIVDRLWLESSFGEVEKFTTLNFIKSSIKCWLMLTLKLERINI
jgi:hypothetical protein